MERAADLLTNGAPRALVVPIKFATDESLIGGIAAATRANVLNSTKIILNEAGLCLAHPGTVGQELGDNAERLAAIIGCNRDEVTRRCHPYVGRDDGGPVVQYGSGTLRRSDLLLNRRRISPASLTIKPHHRMAWCCRLLPFCEESLEHLVDQCELCGEGLRWSRAWGIGTCEYCRQPITEFKVEKLDPALAARYRQFAGLISFVPEIREAARCSLAPELAKLHQPQLVDLIIGLGMALTRDGPLPGREAARLLDAHALASCIALGTELIDEWPKILRGRVGAEHASIQQDAASRKRLVAALRRLGQTIAFSAETAHVIRKALPEAFERSQRALGSLRGPIMLARDVRNLSGIGSADLAILDEAGLLPSITISSGERRQRQYVRAEVEDFANRRRGSVPLSFLAEKLGVPRYAIEQLVCQRQVEWENSAAILAIEVELRITKVSANSFLQMLNDSVSDADAVPNAVTLWSAMRQIGGGAKNWGAVLVALAEGRISAWTRPDSDLRPFVRRVMVLPESIMDLATFDVPAASDMAMPIASTMSNDDACELLNLDNVSIRPVIDAGQLTFKADGNALRTCRQSVERLARQLISAPEIAAVFDIRADKVRARMRKIPTVRTTPGGWSRSDFERHLHQIAP